MALLPVPLRVILSHRVWSPVPVAVVELGDTTARYSVHDELAEPLHHTGFPFFGHIVNGLVLH